MSRWPGRVVRIRSDPGRQRTRSPGRRFSRRRKRGVSDVIATIILLAITVTLFSAIFFFVSSFPSPPAQNVTNFQATLVTNQSSGGSVTVEGVTITHYGGPSVSNSAAVYLQSANSSNSGKWPFNTPLSMKCGGVNGPWFFGQTWSVNFSSPATNCTASPLAPPDTNDAITVTVVSQSTLLYYNILPSVALSSSPPVIVSSWTSPSPIRENSSFQVYATISGCSSASACTVSVNLVSVPGLNATGAVGMIPSTQSGVWVYTTPSAQPPNQPGVYTGVITVISAKGQTAIATVSITVWPT